jgi:hypothetical protein
VGDDDFNFKPRDAPRASASGNWRLRNTNQNQNPASNDKNLSNQIPRGNKRRAPFSERISAGATNIPTNQTPRNKTSGQSRQTNHSNQQTYSSHLKMSNNSKSGNKRKSSSPRFDCFFFFNLSHLKQFIWVKYPYLTPGLPARPSKCHLNHSQTICIIFQPESSFPTFYTCNANISLRNTGIRRKTRSSRDSAVSGSEVTQSELQKESTSPTEQRIIGPVLPQPSANLLPEAQPSGLLQEHSTPSVSSTPNLTPDTSVSPVAPATSQQHVNLDTAGDESSPSAETHAMATSKNTTPDDPLMQPNPVVRDTPMLNAQPTGILSPETTSAILAVGERYVALGVCSDQPFAETLSMAEAKLEDVTIFHTAYSQCDLSFDIAEAPPGGDKLEQLFKDACVLIDDEERATAIDAAVATGAKFLADVSNVHTMLTDHRALHTAGLEAANNVARTVQDTLKEFDAIKTNLNKCVHCTHNAHRSPSATHSGSRSS